LTNQALEEETLEISDFAKCEFLNCFDYLPRVDLLRLSRGYDFIESELSDADPRQSEPGKPADTQFDHAKRTTTIIVVEAGIKAPVDSVLKWLGHDLLEEGKRITEEKIARNLGENVLRGIRTHTMPGAGPGIATTPLMRTGLYTQMLGASLDSKIGFLGDNVDGGRTFRCLREDQQQRKKNVIDTYCIPWADKLVRTVWPQAAEFFVNEFSLILTNLSENC
jgi:hypothetical protein